MLPFDSLVSRSPTLPELPRVTRKVSASTWAWYVVYESSSSSVPKRLENLWAWRSKERTVPS